MGSERRVGAVVGFALLVMASAVGADASRYSGAVIAVDRSAGRIVVEDMGPALSDGKGEIAKRSILVTPSTAFAKVARTSGRAPSGFVGDFVETQLPAWEVQVGDWVAVSVKPGRRGAEALKITVVDTRQP